MKEKLNEIRQKYNIDIPAFMIGFSFFWLLLANVPFLGLLRNYTVYIELIFFCLALLFIRDYKCIKGINVPFSLMLIWFLISMIATKTVHNNHAWFTIIITLASYIVALNSSESIKTKLWKSIFISINIVTILSMIGYLIIRFTDVMNSPIFIVRYSFGNFLQGNRLYGILNNPNTLGPIAAISCFMSVYYIYINHSKKNIAINTAIFVLDAYTLYLSGCRSALLATIVSTVCVLVLSIKKNRKKKFIIIFILYLLAVILLVSTLPLLSKITQRDWETGSGRTALYKSALILIKNSPLIGYGSFSNYLNYCTENNIEMNHAGGTHSNCLEIATTYGIPALIFFIIAVLFLIIKTLKIYFSNIDFYESHLICYITILVFILTYGIFERLMNESSIQVLFIFSFFVAELSINKIQKTDTRM